MNPELESWVDQIIDELEPIELDPTELFSEKVLEILFNSNTYGDF